MIPFYDASSTTADLVAVEILRSIHTTLSSAGYDYVIIGAAARDLAVHGPAAGRPRRVTKDVDIAVAVAVGPAYQRLLSELGEKDQEPQRIRVLGCPVDVVPFAAGAREVRLGSMTLNVLGLREATDHPALVQVSDGLVLPVSAIQAQAALKILAWGDRAPGTQKDAGDLGEILEASSRGLFADLAWEDDEALDSCDGDIAMMGPYRLGSSARALLRDESSTAVRDILDARGKALGSRLRVPEGPELLAAFRRGLGR
ncbi:hypothetical protein [Phycicoccus flavus]|uniref:hypothetical protein n=1 Tax=Phycicoccus flavus TaxID=2502783 RepID=UPI000FEB9DC5|nr:hypothetical protein [Phycicoccus flavus]NHA69576.1 hypothetical protein [Phycicoccus flavus]